jgi:hypothetical protein
MARARSPICTAPAARRKGDSNPRADQDFFWGVPLMNINMIFTDFKDEHYVYRFKWGIKHVLAMFNDDY